MVPPSFMRVQDSWTVTILRVAIGQSMEQPPSYRQWFGKRARLTAADVVPVVVGNAGLARVTGPGKSAGGHGEDGGGDDGRYLHGDDLYGRLSGRCC